MTEPTYREACYLRDWFEVDHSHIGRALYLLLKWVVEKETFFPHDGKVYTGDEK